MKADSRIVGSALAALFVFTCAGCADERVEQSAPEMASYYIGDDEAAPGFDLFGETPDSDELTIDFKLVDAGTVSRRYLFLRNTGDSDLKLASLEVEAGTSADFEITCSAGCQEVKPGDDLVIQVAYGPLEVGYTAVCF